MRNKLLLALVITSVISCQAEKKEAKLPPEKQNVNSVITEDNSSSYVSTEPTSAASISPEELERIAAHEKYRDNSLITGTAPYTKMYGGNKACDDFGCSKIKVITSNSDVMVTIKRNDKVVRHAFIRSGDSYVFEMPDGTYQAFFYYGKGWNPEKEIILSNGKIIKGGFLADESFGKDEPQRLSNNQLTYELITQPNGNFSTQPSSAEEAL